MADMRASASDVGRTAMVACCSVLSFLITVVNALESPSRVESFTLAGERWTAFRSNTHQKGKLYFQRSDGSVTWTDPRKALAVEEGRLTGFFALFIALAVICICGGAWVTYLVIKYPRYFRGTKGKGGKTNLKFSPAASPRRNTAATANGRSGSPAAKGAAPAKAE